jgi:hypothetical protein
LRKTPFFAENWQTLQKIVIITSTPGKTHPFGGLHQLVKRSLEHDFQNQLDEITKQQLAWEEQLYLFCFSF